MKQMFMNEDTPADPSVAPVTMGEIIFDCAEAEFEEKVLKASMERPIIVDFWAPWCGPCKQLMPLLESAVQAAGGEVSLAKINLDEKSIFTEAKTALELAQNTPSGESAALQAAVEGAPDNHQARYDLAIAQFAEGSREAALDNLLHIIEADREWNEEAARTQLLKFFEAMGHGDPLTMSARRKLSSILFS